MILGVNNQLLDNTKRILIDLGTVTSSSYLGNTWNNVTTTASGVKIADLVDTDNVATGIELAFNNPLFFGNLTDGPNQNISDYPASACSDCFFYGNTSPTSIELNNLPAGTYNIKLWGSRVTGGSLSYILEAQANGGGYLESPEQHNNTDYNSAIILSSISPSSGSITIDIRQKTGVNSALLGIIDITY